MADADGCAPGAQAAEQRRAPSDARTTGAAAGGTAAAAAAMHAASARRLTPPRSSARCWLGCLIVVLLAVVGSFLGAALLIGGGSPHRSRCGFSPPPFAMISGSRLPRPATHPASPPVEDAENALSPKARATPPQICACVRRFFPLCTYVQERV
jgi:hypothetical protein